MKRTYIFLIFVLAALLCACGSKITNEEVKLSVLSDFSEYKIVRSENSSAAEKEALVELNKAIREKTGISMKVATDYTSGTKEILVGKTKRQQSSDALNGLGYGDFAIKQIGSKIVIVGGSDKAITDAVKYFIENCIDAENKTLMVPGGDGFVKKSEYKLKRFIIGDIGIENFQIKADEATKEAALKLAEDIMNTYVGCEMKIFEGEMKKDEHYLILDATGLNYGKYSISTKDGNIYIKGSVRSIEAAINAFYGIMDDAKGILELAADGEMKGSIPVPQIPYKNKDELLEILEYLQENDEIIFGQHLAGSMDLNGSIAEYTDAVGEGPAIMDIDMFNFNKYRRLSWSETICQAVEYAAKGGIITTMHHWNNPVHPEDAYRGRLDTLDQWQEVLTPGTELNKKWHEELDCGAEFLKALRDSGVSVMFRPMHEANGDWFWFCAGHGDMGNIDSRDMVAMWKYVYNYYTNECGLDNLLWTYSPNLSNSENSPFPVTYYYPGDEYCDVVGIDWYTAGAYEIDGEGKSWDVLLEYNKPAGLAEWGIGDALQAGSPEKQIEFWNCENFVEYIEKMHDEGKNIAFIEVYNDRFGAPSYVGKGEALSNCELLVSLEEMPAFIEKVLGK